MPVCPLAWNDSAPTGLIFMEFDVREFFKNLTRITGALHEDVCTFMIISRSIIFRMRKVRAVCGSYSTAALRHIVLLPK